MFKTTKQPIEEDMNIYEAESSYLRQEPNEAIYYIDGKVIVMTDSGKQMYGQLLEEDKEFFVFGSQLEAEGLLPVSELGDKDREMLFSLNEINSVINSKGLHVVSLEKVKEKGNEIVYAIIAHEKHSENSYFRLTVPELHQLTPDQIDELPSYNEERTLDNPYHVQLEGDMLLAY